jgi:transglutaminase-like putative cysteine protease
MLRAFAVSALVLFAATLVAEGAPAAPEPPFEVAKEHIDADVNADGTFLQASEIAYRVLDATGQRALQQITLSYTSGYQELGVTEAYTLKADGRRVDVKPGNILYGRGASSAPGYEDISTVTIVFPDLAVGDEIVLTTLLNQKTPWIAGQFASGVMFEPGVAQRDARFSVSVPANYPLRMDETGMQGGEPVTAGGKTRRTWTYRDDAATAPEPGAVMNVNASPHVFVSSFNDYEAVARAASNWFAGKADVTPEIQALADKVTAGIQDRRRIAEKLYDWVSTHITYEQIVLGAGGFVPHAAAQVLATRYGDCKDHVMLLQALLAAKGISSSPALISVSASFDLPRAATPYAFNHVITYIREFHLFVDSTAQFAPFGILPDADAGRPVLLTATGEEMQTPNPDSADNRISVVEKIAISPDGNATGDSTVSAQGPAAVDLRGLVSSIPASQEPEYFRHVLGPGAEGSLTRGDPTALTPDYSYSSHYTMSDAANFPGPGALPPWIGYKPFYLTDYVAGSLPPSRSMPYACPSITAEEDVTIDLPSSVQITSLPHSGTLSAPGVSLAITTQQLKSNEVHQITTLRIDHPQAVCTADYYNSVHDSLRKMVAALKEQILYK